MAYIDINLEFKRILVRFDASVPAELLMQAPLYFRIEDGTGNWVYTNALTMCANIDGQVWVIPNVGAERLMQMIMPSYGVAMVGYLMDDEFRHGEAIRFSAQLMNLAYEPLSLSRHCRPFHDKGPKVAVFTQTFNEGDMLLYWERYYGQQVGYENLYVLNNASTDGSCARLNPATNVINMPAVKVDHFEFAHSQSYFQRFLLMRYHWVIKADADELLVFEDGLEATLERLVPGTYCPELALEPAHDMEGEEAFRFDASLYSQRKHFVEGDMSLQRPLLSSKPTTWSSGNHVCYEANSVLPGFAVVHLKYFDFDFLHEKNRKWAQIQTTEYEQKTCEQIAMLSKLDDDAIHALTTSEISIRLARQRAPLPAWLAATLS